MIRVTSALIAAPFALFAYVTPAPAQVARTSAAADPGLARTYVSSVNGNDGNDCNRLTPCRTFQVAHDKTLANGEITVLDPGGYGAVTITKTISIINDGVGEAGVLVSGGLIGITVNAGPFDRVSLRGLTVKGIGFGGGNGIRFNTGASLTIENSAIRNHTGDGIQMLGNVPAGAQPAFILSNTFVADNGGNGILVQPGGTVGSLRVTLTRVEMYNNSANGFAVTSPIARVTIADSTASHNGFSGFSATNNSSLAVKRVVAAHNAVDGIIFDQALGFPSEAIALYNLGFDIRCANHGTVVVFHDSVVNSFDVGNCSVSTPAKF